MLKYKLLTPEVTRWLKGICPKSKKKIFLPQKNGLILLVIFS